MSLHGSAPLRKLLKKHVQLFGDEETKGFRFPTQSFGIWAKRNVEIIWLVYEESPETQLLSMQTEHIAIQDEQVWPRAELVVPHFEGHPEQRVEIQKGLLETCNFKENSTSHPRKQKQN